ncbi:endolytic transglycosylase MltG [Nocardioides montaniterrae]
MKRILTALVVAVLAMTLAACGTKDFPGPGSGSVTVTIPAGATVTDMGRALKDAGVVASVDAFLNAANGNSKATGIQPGSYTMKKEMKASDVVSYLVDPHHMVQDLVTVPEGTRTADVVKIIVRSTHFKRAAIEKVLAHPAGLGLPAYAHGNPEGYLFPATYPVQPGDTPTTLIKAMIAKGNQERDSIDLVAAAKKVNLDPDQVVTVASILEFEASRSVDYPKVARAIYNRLKIGMAIQSDATVSYANASTGEIWTTAEQRNSDSPYNTYKHTGLPPGPIGNPGLETLKAALNPAAGPWTYWVVVNLRTGETKYATSLSQHNQQVAEFHKYCQTSDAC